MPPIDMDTFELNSDDDNDIDAWCDDFWNLGTPRQRLEPIITRIGRSLEEILELEVEIIQSCTDLSPELWIEIYWKKFRDIMDIDSSWTISQIKRKLYIEK